MEKPMDELMRNATGATPRRGFFRRIAGAMALGLVLRHDAFPLALGDEMWRKYKMGEAFKINDPETKAPALKNPFLHPKAGVLPADGMAITGYSQAAPCSAPATSRCCSRAGCSPATPG